MAATPFQPEEFGHYKLTHLLGKGGMASVFRATREGPWGFAKQVALKRLHASLNENQGILKALINEARIGGQLKHTNIVEVYEFNKVRIKGVDAYYLAMEFVDGWTLDKVLKLSREFVEPIPLEVALDIVIQSCAGLHYAHTLETLEGEKVKLVHRDIKPGNIIVSRDGVAKVMDFGIAKATTNLYHTTLAGETTKGTPHYMSPEQVAGDPDINARSDLFAMGSLIYELVTGKLLFRGDSLVSVLFAVAKAQVDDELLLLDDYAPGLMPIVKRCLHKDPLGRYGTCEELAEELRMIRGDTAGQITLRGYLHTLRWHLLARDSHLQDETSTVADERGPAFATLLGPDWAEDEDDQNTEQLAAAREIADDLIGEIQSLRGGPDAVAGAEDVNTLEETSEVDALSELQMSAKQVAQLSPAREARSRLSVPGDAARPDAETAAGPSMAFSESAVDRTRDFPPAAAKKQGLDKRLLVLLILFGVVGAVGILFIGTGGDSPVAKDDPPPVASSDPDVEGLPDLNVDSTPAPVERSTRGTRREPRTPAPPVRADSTPAAVATSDAPPVADLPEPTLAPGPPPAGDVIVVESTPSPRVVYGGKPGRLMVGRSPISLIVLVDGEAIGNTPIFGHSLPPGQHTVRMKNPQTGAFSPARTVTIPANGKKVIGWYDFQTGTWKD
ncbi:MAG: protein kinase [Proteobacteria bacterium]|nr:protein kinase [Pseudomonadota bacterium]